MTKNVGVCIALISILCGCDRVKVERIPLEPAEPSGNVAADTQDSVDATVVEADPDDGQFSATAWIEKKELPYEAYFIQYMDGKRVGCFKTEVTAGESALRIRQIGSYAIPASGKVNRYTTELESLEFWSGKMVSFRDITRTAAGVVEAVGEVDSNRIVVRVEDEEGPERVRSTWKDTYWGVLGIQSVTKAQPLQPGEQRACTVFVPRINRALRVELEAGQPELSALPGGVTPMLIPLDVKIFDGDKLSRSQTWIDDQGEIMKTMSQDGTIVSTFRASKLMGERVMAEMAVEGKLGTICKFYGLPPSATDEKAVYMVESTDFDVFSSLNRKVRQRVKSISALSAQVAVLDVWNPEVRELEQGPPQPADRASSEWLSLERPAVISLAEEILSEAQDLGKGLQEQARTEDEQLVLNVSKVLATSVKHAAPQARVAGADETARTMQGDVTAKAVLLTAVLRKNGIPARLAVGMRIDADGKSLSYYSWVEAWVNQRWLPLDASAGDVVGIDCIKLVETSLEGHPYAEMLAAYKTMERVTVRRVSEEQ